MSAVRTGRTLLPETLVCAFGTNFCYRLSKPQGLVTPEGLDKLKKNNNSPHLVLNPRPFGL
jgi:hypothetical protein